MRAVARLGLSLGTLLLLLLGLELGARIFVPLRSFEPTQTYRVLPDGELELVRRAAELKLPVERGPGTAPFVPTWSFAFATTRVSWMAGPTWTRQVA